MPSTRRRTLGRSLAAVAALAVAALLAACGDDDTATKVRLLTHESFDLSEDVLAAFTEETGIEIEVIQGGDAGTIVNQAILAKGNPQADVLFGIDSTLLSRALSEGIFVPYEADGLDEVDDAFKLDDENRVTPIDYGDVCINYDKEHFESTGLAVPTSLEDLTRPEYKDLLVVQNPATSSSGLAFLLATVAEFGEDGWQDFWSDLKANGVLVTDGWSDAYYGEFSGGAGEGERPLVLSYASSPPVEVIYADPPVDEAPTGVITAGCYRQVEAAGILAGTENEKEAGLLIDFLLSPAVQADVPLTMFVYPVRDGIELPEEFTDHVVAPDDVAELDPDVVEENRDAWIDEWTDIVIR